MTLPHRPFEDDDDEVDDGRIKKKRFGSISPDMNVTPLIDVLLVLLVIFMAALPLTQLGVDINLPLEVSPHAAPQDTKQVVLEYTKDHKLLVNKREVAVDDLAEMLKDMYSMRSDKTVFVVGDASVTYGEVVTVIDAAAANSLRIAIVTEGMKQEGKGGG